MTATPADTESRLAEVERRTRQQGEDVNALYGLVEDLDRKVTEGFERMEEGFERVTERFEQVTERFERVAEGFERMDRGFAAVLAELRGPES